MFLKNITTAALTSLYLIVSIVNAVENSIIPVIEHFEQIENLQSKKYSKNQFQEITTVLQRKEEKVRIVSYNILFNYHDDTLSEENRWPQRMPRMLELFEEMQPDIICVQELLPNQLKDLTPFLQSTYSYYSRKGQEGELNGIFFRKDRFEVIKKKFWYMSASKEKPSLDALTMIHLKDLKNDKVFAVFNAHLSFSRPDRREGQARFIAKTIEPFSVTMPVILTGDLNTFPHRLDAAALPFYDGDYIHRILTKKILQDAKCVSLLGHLGPLSTFTNDPENPQCVPFTGTGTPGVFLDHVYVSKEINVLIHAIQPGTVHGHYPSDHLPVVVDFIVD